MRVMFSLISQSTLIHLVEISGDAKYMYGTGKPGWVIISMDEYVSMMRTIGVLSNEDLIEQIEAGKRDTAKIMDFEELARTRGVKSEALHIPNRICFLQLLAVYPASLGTQDIPI